MQVIYFLFALKNFQCLFELIMSTWNPHTKRNTNKIEMVQHRAARFVHNDYSRTSHVTPMIQQLGWDTLEHRRLLAQLIMFYKINQGMVGLNFPPEVSPLFRRQSSRLPNPQSFNHIRTNIDAYKFSFFPRTIVTWNQSPPPPPSLITLPQSVPSRKQPCPLLGPTNF